jgi:hypothetical protein
MTKQSISSGELIRAMLDAGATNVEDLHRHTGWRRVDISHAKSFLLQQELIQIESELRRQLREECAAWPSRIGA